MSTKNKKLRRVVAGIGLGIIIIGGGYAVWQDNLGLESVVPVEDKVDNSTEPTKVKTNPNAESSIESFLIKWSEAKGEVVQTLITNNFNSVTGYYAYPVSVVEKGKSYTLDLGLSLVEVAEQKVIGHKGFLDSVVDLKEGDNGLALVEYKDNNITSVEVYQLDYSFEDIQESILSTDFSKGKTITEAKPEKEEKTYNVLTAEDWQGMALLTSREIVASNMAPIFIVPTTNVRGYRDLTETFYYIIAGTIEGASAGKTSLRTYKGKKISLDFSVPADEEDFGQPAWIHVITKDGKIQNVELQTFKSANLLTMAEGLTSYINVSYATHANE